MSDSSSSSDSGGTLTRGGRYSYRQQYRSAHGLVFVLDVDIDGRREPKDDAENEDDRDNESESDRRRPPSRAGGRRHSAPGVATALSLRFSPGVGAGPARGEGRPQPLDLRIMSTPWPTAIATNNWEST